MKMMKAEMRVFDQSQSLKCTATDVKVINEEQESWWYDNYYEGGEGDSDKDGKGKAGDLEQESDVDDLDFDNFKGIYFGDENKKYQDPDTGCHFEYYDLCKRLAKLKEQRKKLDKELGLPPETPPQRTSDV